MFYSQVMLAKKGPLGMIWVAAHYDKKLTKNQIFSTDITSSVDSVLNPASPLALRVSGHLMLGIVRIYARKVRYLVSDCTEAMWKINLILRPGNVDIDPNMETAMTDDIRDFGEVPLDVDFPGLDDFAYPSYMLEGRNQSFHENDPLWSQDSLRGAQYPSPMLNISNGFSEHKMRESNSNTPQSSHTSDVELMRDDRSRSNPSIKNRGSLSIGRRDRHSSLSAIVGFDDDVPAFESHFESFGDMRFASMGVGIPSAEQNRSGLIDLDGAVDENVVAGFDDTADIAPVGEIVEDTQKNQEYNLEDDKVEHPAPKRRGKKSRAMVNRNFLDVVSVRHYYFPDHRSMCIYFATDR